MNFSLKYLRFGENSILVEWPEAIQKKILIDIIQFKCSIEKNHNVESLKSSYNSLLIEFKDLKNFNKKIENLRKLYFNKKSAEIPNFYRWTIPVCYEEEFGIDLKRLEKKLELKKDQIISIHNSSNYIVYNIGFVPGFLYLGGLNKKIHCPRKESPLQNVLKGSVGIGGSQTGIYPQNSPGGWNIIGNSPINLFDPNNKPPCIIKSGDQVCFERISLEEHSKIKIDIELNKFKLKKIKYD